MGYDQSSAASQRVLAIICPEVKSRGQEQWVVRNLLWLEQSEVDGCPPFHRASFNFSKLSKFCFGFFSTQANLICSALACSCDSKELWFCVCARAVLRFLLPMESPFMHPVRAALSPANLFLKLLPLPPLSQRLKFLAADWGIRSAFFTVEEGKVGNSEWQESTCHIFLSFSYKWPTCSITKAEWELWLVNVTLDSWTWTVLMTYRQQPLSGSVLRSPGTAVRVPDCLWQCDRFCDRKPGVTGLGKEPRSPFPILLGCL